MKQNLDLDLLKRQLSKGKVLQLSEDERVQLKTKLQDKKNFLQVIDSALLGTRSLNLHHELLNIFYYATTSESLDVKYQSVIVYLEDEIRNDSGLKNILEIYYLYTGIERPPNGVTVHIAEKVKIVQKDLFNIVYNEIQNLYAFEYTALSNIIEKNYIGIVKLLVHHPKVDVNVKNKEGDTTLHWAVRYRNAEITKALLNHPRIDVNAKNKCGETALHWTIWHRNAEITKALLNHPKIDVNAKDQCGDTPLHMAVHNGKIEFAIALISHPRMDPNIRCGYLHHLNMRSLFLIIYHNTLSAMYELYTTYINELPQNPIYVIRCIELNQAIRPLQSHSDDGFYRINNRQ